MTILLISKFSYIATSRLQNILSLTLLDTIYQISKLFKLLQMINELFTGHEFLLLCCYCKC